MKSCKHYSIIDGYYKSLIKKNVDKYICKQCCRIIDKNDAAIIDEYCSIRNTFSKTTNPLAKEIQELRIYEMITWVHPRFPYREKKSNVVDEYINPFF